MQLSAEQKRKLFLAVLGGLAAVLIITGAVVLALEHAPGAGDGRGDDGGLAVPDGELLVSDVYEGETLIPRFELARNNYDPQKFVEKDGFLRYDDPNARLGVDVSEYQGEIDWAAVKAAGVDFAIIRLGWRGTTQGKINEDAAFERNLTGATEAGLFVGVYFFSQAVTEAEAEEEADFVLRTLNGRKLAYPVMFDWEQTFLSGDMPEESYRVYGLSGQEATRCSTAFCEKIEAAGYTAGVYTNKHLAYNFFDMGQWQKYDIWYAEYQKQPSLYYDFRIWQYTESGTVPGIDGGVDMNICFKPY